MDHGQAGTGGSRTAAGVLEPMLRRALVAQAGRVGTVQDMLDAAELALASGRPDAARMLFEVAFVRAGFSPERRRARRATLSRVALWPGLADEADEKEAAEPGFAMDVATRDLAALMDAAGPLADNRTEPPPAGEVATVPPPEPAAVAAVAGLLFRGLHQADGAMVAEALALASTMALDRARPAPPGAPAMLDALASAAALQGLAGFFALHHGLCWGPSGSARLLLGAARLRDGGLGPYFTQVPTLLRTVRDLTGLAERAGRGGAIEPWLALLAIHLDADMRVQLADLAGDRAMPVLLAGLLALAQHNTGEQAPALWPIRDAALDLGLPGLASSAQATIAGLAPDRHVEWLVLGELLATAGEAAAAEKALLMALRLAPRDPAVLERLAALDRNRFGAFHVTQGYASPPWRVALRARQRAAT